MDKNNVTENEPRTYKRERRKRICKICGKEYVITKLNTATKRCCSKECSIIACKNARKPHFKQGLPEISDYYKDKGFSRLYIATNPEGRKVATLRKSDGYMTSMSYAKYLYTSHYMYDIPKGDQVDHINGDKTDDRIENLQVISGYYNRVKDRPRKVMIQKTCPICGCDFLIRKGNEKDKEQCCSRVCGRKHASITLKSIRLHAKP